MTTAVQTSMDVLNPLNIRVFNHLIEEGRQKLAKELPSEVLILLPSGMEGLSDPVVTMEVSDEERMDYIRHYVDELDLFGNDLAGHIRNIMRTAIHAVIHRPMPIAQDPVFMKNESMGICGRGKSISLAEKGLSGGRRHGPGFSDPASRPATTAAVPWTSCVMQKKRFRTLPLS